MQNLVLSAGAVHANRDYWIFGSITGTRPGIRLLGLDIPLHPDAYTYLAMANANSATFRRFRGRLDAMGSATASLVVPASPSVSGTLYHAFVVHDGQGRLHMASNPVSLSLR